VELSEKFLITQNFHEINFRDLRGKKNCTLAHSEALNLDFFYVFLDFLNDENYLNQKIRVLNIAKMAFFEMLLSPELISCKI